MNGTGIEKQTSLRTGWDLGQESGIRRLRIVARDEIKLMIH